MNRRNFLAKSALAGLAVLGVGGIGQGKQTGNEFIAYNELVKTGFITSNNYIIIIGKSGTKSIDRIGKKYILDANGHHLFSDEDWSQIKKGWLESSDHSIPYLKSRLYGTKDLKQWRFV